MATPANTTDETAKDEGAPALDDAGASPAEGSDKAAEEKPAEEQKPKKQMLDVVTEAIKATADKKAAGDDPDTEDEEDDEDDPSAEKKPQKEPAPKAPESEDGEISPEEMKLLPKKTARRVKQLLADRKARADERDAVIVERNTLQPKAASFDQIVGYMRDAELSPDEVSTGFEIMRLIRHDPIKALEAIKPYYEGLLQITGQIIPPDLQRDVDAGALSEAHARQLAQANSRGVLAQQQAERASQRATQLQNAQSEQAAAAQRNGAWLAWEAVQKTADVDYDAKRDFIVQAAQARLRNGIPSDQAGLNALFDQAKADVETRLQAFRPRKKSTSVTPATPTKQSNSAPNLPPPKSMREALDRALGS